MGTRSGGFRWPTELRRPGGVREVRRAGTTALTPGKAPEWAGKGTTNRFSSRSRPALPAEIPGGFSSSLLPPSFLRGRFATLFCKKAAPSSGSHRAVDLPTSLDMDEIETWAIRKALKQTGGNVSHAAKLLGMSRDTLHTKIKKKGIDREAIVNSSAIAGTGEPVTVE